MNIKQRESDPFFSKRSNSRHLVVSNTLPPTHLITKAYIFAFDGDRLLMISQKSRGWHLPGGQVKADEAPEQTARRTVLETAGARLNQMEIFAHIRTDEPAENTHSCCVFYWAHIDTLEPFSETSEVFERRLFDPEGSRQLDDVKNNRTLYYAAFDAAVDLTPKPEAAWKQKAHGLAIRRGNDNRYELLVMQFDGYPNWPFHVPGGRVEENEMPEEAMYRELHEESGLGRLKMLRKLGVHRYYKYHIESNVERHDYLLLAPRNLPDQWAHTVTGQGGDADSVFQYYWIGPDEIDRLSDELNTFVTPKHIPELFGMRSEVK